jgi:hypothetical protein
MDKAAKRIAAKLQKANLKTTGNPDTAAGAAEPTPVEKIVKSTASGPNI